MQLVITKFLHSKQNYHASTPKAPEWEKTSFKVILQTRGLYPDLQRIEQIKY